MLRIGPLWNTNALLSVGPIKILGIWIHSDNRSFLDLNYDPLLVKARSTLAAWKNISLTLIGKIQVINTLVTSQFVYKLMSLPTPSEAFFKAYKKIVTDYLWDEEVHSIRYSKLIQNYNDGGLKLVDLELKDKVLKASWVSRINPVKTKLTSAGIYVSLPIKNHVGGGGADLRRRCFLAKTCTKMKELGPVGGGGRPVDPPIRKTFYSKWKLFINM